MKWRGDDTQVLQINGEAHQRSMELEGVARIIIIGSDIDIHIDIALVIMKAESVKNIEEEWRLITDDYIYKMLDE